MPLLRSVTRLALLATLWLATPPKARAADLVYPDTAPGRHAREFFAAFNGGEAAMREFWTAHGSPAALAARPVSARLEVWRTMRDNQGSLTPVRVAGSGDDWIDVDAVAERGGALTIHFACDDTPAHGLVALRLESSDDTAGRQDGPPPAPGAAPGAVPGAAIGAAPPAAPGPPPSDAEIVARLSSELDSLSRAGAFSGAAMLDKDGHTLFARAYGLADRATQSPNRLETRFNVGSINKIFTHVAIM